LRERIPLSKGGRSLLQGRGEELNTLETEGHEHIKRIISDLKKEGYSVNYKED